MPDTAPQPTSEPTRKTTASIIAGSLGTALSTLITWALQTYTHVEVPPPVQVAVVTVLTVGAAYLTNERTR